MGEYYSDAEIDAILNNHAITQESIREAIKYSKSLENKFAMIRHEIAHMEQKYQSLLCYAKEMHTILVNEIGPTRTTDEFKEIFLDERP